MKLTPGFGVVDLYSKASYVWENTVTSTTPRTSSSHDSATAASTAEVYPASQSGQKTCTADIGTKI